MVNPPLEGVQEFKMMTSGYSAEFGRYAGGVLSVVTKSGTNRLRGTLYEFLRNDVLDATGYFDVEKSKLRRNQFGATVTGPVYLPKIYDGRNRTFFHVHVGVAAGGGRQDAARHRALAGDAARRFLARDGRVRQTAEDHRHAGQGAVSEQPDSGQPARPGVAEDGGLLPAAEPDRVGEQFHLAGQRHDEQQQFRHQGGSSARRTKTG